MPVSFAKTDRSTGVDRQYCRPAREQRIEPQLGQWRHQPVPKARALRRDDLMDYVGSVGDHGGKASKQIDSSAAMLRAEWIR